MICKEANFVSDRKLGIQRWTAYLFPHARRLGDADELGRVEARVKAKDLPGRLRNTSPVVTTAQQRRRPMSDPQATMIPAAAAGGQHPQPTATVTAQGQQQQLSQAQVTITPPSNEHVSQQADPPPPPAPPAPVAQNIQMQPPPSQQQYQEPIYAPVPREQRRASYHAESRRRSMSPRLYEEYPSLALPGADDLDRVPSRARSPPSHARAYSGRRPHSYGDEPYGAPDAVSWIVPEEKRQVRRTSVIVILVRARA
ncbi:hypothetical protein BC834DRAFT_643851 [Gloeopeniophorella convolvens]|nr:hypothetical protein BC834DRAFT_643851 [Gloeopeniophorella convolvens]